jgi:hypothetical protein
MKHACLPISATTVNSAADDTALAQTSKLECWLHVVRLLAGSYRDRLRRHILMQQQPSHQAVSEFRITLETSNRRRYGWKPRLRAGHVALALALARLHSSRRPPP